MSKHLKLYTHTCVMPSPPCLQLGLSRDSMQLLAKPPSEQDEGLHEELAALLPASARALLIKRQSISAASSLGEAAGMAALMVADAAFGT